MPFACSICGEESTRICVWCTKDTCANHLCEKCGRCSDCCECEVPLDEPVHQPAQVYAASETAAEPEIVDAAAIDPGAPAQPDLPPADTAQKPDL